LYFQLPNTWINIDPDNDIHQISQKFKQLSGWLQKMSPTYYN
jgi:hypothetical protein